MAASAEEREALLPESRIEAQNTYGVVTPDYVERAGSDGDRPPGRDDGPRPAEAADAAQGKGEEPPKVRMIYVLPALALGMFLSALDGSVVNTNYAKIATDFNSLELASWISSSYYLTYAPLQPLYGKLSDVYGRKPCILAAYALFGVGCLLCGLAPTMPAFLAARVVQGGGAAGIGTLVTVLLSDVVPLRERAPWQGYLNLINALGLSIGAPIGGLAADTVGWRATFLCQAPLAALAVLSVAWFLRVPAAPAKRDGPRRRLRNIDFLGALGLVLTIVALLVGLDRGSVLGFAHPASVVPLALTPVFLVALVLAERYVAADPILSRAIVADRTLAAIYATNFFAFGAWMAMTFFIPLFYQAVDGVSSTQAGIRLLPAIGCAVAGNVLCAHALRRWQRYYALLMIGGLVMTVAMAPVLVATWKTESDVALVSVGLGLNSFFYGGAAVASLIALLAAAAPAAQATATATMFLARSLGAAVAVSLGGSLLQAVLRLRLGEALRDWHDGGGGVDPDRVVEGVRRSLEYLRALDPALRAVVQVGYAQAVRAVLWAVTAAFAASWFSAWWVVERKMD